MLVKGQTKAEKSSTLESSLRQEPSILYGLMKLDHFWQTDQLQPIIIIILIIQIGLINLYLKLRDVTEINIVMNNANVQHSQPTHWICFIPFTTQNITLIKYYSYLPN